MQRQRSRQLQASANVRARLQAMRQKSQKSHRRRASVRAQRAALLQPSLVAASVRQSRSLRWQASSCLCCSLAHGRQRLHAGVAAVLLGLNEVGLTTMFWGSWGPVYTSSRVA